MTWRQYSTLDIAANSEDIVQALNKCEDEIWLPIREWQRILNGKSFIASDGLGYLVYHVVHGDRQRVLCLDRVINTDKVKFDWFGAMQFIKYVSIAWKIDTVEIRINDPGLIRMIGKVVPEGYTTDIVTYLKIKEK